MRQPRKAWCVLVVLLVSVLHAWGQRAPSDEKRLETVGWTPGESPTATSVQIAEIDAQEKGAFKLREFDRSLEALRDARDDLFNLTGLRLAFFYTALFQQATNGSGALSAAAGDLDLLASWTIWGREAGTPGALIFDVEYRHAIGFLAPSALNGQIGSLQRTTNGFNDRGWVLRNLHYTQRMLDDRVRFLIGRADPADYVGAHAMQNVNTMFFNRAFSSASTVPFPSHGLAAGLSVVPGNAYYTTALVTNAYADTTTNDWGDLSRGEFFYGLESGWTPEFSGLGRGRYRVFFWHIDERSRDALPADTGFSVIADQELGENWLAFARYGWGDRALTGIKSSAQVGVGYRDLFNVSGSMVGVAGAVSESVVNARTEKTIEGFLRVQLTSFTQASVGMQGIFDPVFASDSAVGVLSCRIRVAF